MHYEVFALPLNPEPWKVGKAFVYRDKGTPRAGIGPDKTVQTYQEAIREELKARGVEVKSGPYSLYFTFSRQLAQWKKNNRTYTRNAADATNMQKATEDALQGVLIGNDRDVVRVGSVVVEQGITTTPFVVIEILYELGEEDPTRLEGLHPTAVDEAIASMIKDEAEKASTFDKKEVWEF